jgi:hypothetical protein
VSSSTPIQQFIVGDKVMLRLVIRHKPNIVTAKARFTHVDVATHPIAKVADAQLVEREADAKTSLLIFEPIEVEPRMTLGVYKCTTLETTYATKNKTSIEIPDTLKFEIVEDPPDTPEVQQVQWETRSQTSR